MHNTLYKVLFTGTIFLAGFALMGGCRTSTSNSNTTGPRSATTPGDAAPPVVKPATPFSSADVAKLKWVEGTWRASGENMESSFERYTFDDDTALTIERFDDDKMSKPTESTRFELKDGEFGATSSNSRWTANEITGDSVTFFRVTISKPTPASNAPSGHPPVEMPDYGPRSLRWQNNRDGTWKATVDWPETGDQKAMQKTFVMERWPR